MIYRWIYYKVSSLFWSTFSLHHKVHFPLHFISIFLTQIFNVQSRDCLVTGEKLHFSLAWPTAAIMNHLDAKLTSSSGFFYIVRMGTRRHHLEPQPTDLVSMMKTSETWLQWASSPGSWEISWAKQRCLSWLRMLSRSWREKTKLNQMQEELEQEDMSWWGMSKQLMDLCQG